MKLGLVSAILEHLNFEELIDFLSKNGFDCVEVACWPSGNKTRKYAGVSHIDVDSLDDRNVQHIKQLLKEKKIEISALAYYPNVLSHDEKIKNDSIDHLKKVIVAAHKLDVPFVTTFIGRDQFKTIDDNLTLIPQVWNPILELAEELSVKIAIENCPMLFTKDEWPGGQNIMTSPENWKKVFDVLKSPNLGLNFDPSHFIWQQLDYIQAVRDFKDKIMFIHFKDIKLFQDKLKRVGVMAYPLEYMDPKLPGYGDVKWDEFVSVLSEIGYDGFASIEVEDRAFEQSEETIENSVLISKRYISNIIY